MSAIGTTVGPPCWRLDSSAPQLLRCWRQRVRDRRQLARLDARLLRDIGMDPEQVLREIRRPFWVG